MEMMNRVAVITGGSGGIGKAMAKAFLAEGAKSVVLADLNADAVNAAAVEIGCSGKTCDVTNEAQDAALGKEIMGEHGKIEQF